ncbi:tRNA pseudouridine(38-40) synthase TruA [Eubacteriales bacterium OttesenSCG-928-N13]|nr:tRNA pseudouridine(38-40) synthase TruA [Eubacteriales bacterium OttesenSCG-928-N13]
MRRVKLIVEYDGTDYAGWQRQINALTVQQVLEDALSELAQEQISCTGASRTDAGVHSLGQTVHFDTRCSVPDDKFCYALNTMLPADIRVRESCQAEPDFHARFHAKRKQYRYLIHNHAHAGALNRNTHAHVMYPLDIEAMQREAYALIGLHDFAAFAASGSIVKDTMREIYSAQLEREGDEVRLFVLGNGFLYNMVRIIAGTLIGVGTGKLMPGAISSAIDTGDRLLLGPTAPAHGLTLMRIWYS